MKNHIEAKYLKRVPKGCPPFDVVRLRMFNMFGKKVEIFFTPDEAMYVANHLLGASMEALCDDPHFQARFITPRLRLAKYHSEEI